MSPKFIESESDSRFDEPRVLSDVEIEYIEDLRSSFKYYEKYIKHRLRPSRERSNALKDMETVIFWIERAVLTTGLEDAA